MATKSKNISLKSKFQDNTPNLYTKQDLKNDKLSKIKVSLQKSKIKNKKAIISLNKRVYKNKQTTDFINTSFSELIKSNPNVESDIFCFKRTSEVLDQVALV